MLREYAWSLTFVVLLIVGYTTLMLANRKPVEAKTEPKAEVQAPHSRSEASIKPAIEATSPNKN